jgi:tetratricopeptide (TPR) repeat protein
MQHRIHRILCLAAVAALSACSGATRQHEVTVNETRAGDGQAVQVEAGATPEWGEKRGELLRTFAFRALERDLLEEGRQYLAQACEADPNDGVSHAALARLYLAEGDPQAALVYAQRASAASPENPEVSMVYAAALAETNQPEEAALQLESAWEAVATDPEFARSILLHYAALGETDRAQDFVTHCMIENPERAGTWAAAGDLMLAQGDLEGAAEGYRRALEIDPTISTPESMDDLIGRSKRSEDPMLSAARAAEAHAKWKEAENLYRFIAGRDLTSPEAHLGLARCLDAQQRFAECEVQLAMVPYGVRGWRGHLLQARLDVREQRWPLARAALMLALQERPGLRPAQLLLEFVETQQDLVAQQND